MTRREAYHKAECLRRANLVQERKSQPQEFDSINAAKRFVGRRTCVELRKHESFRE